MIDPDPPAPDLVLVDRTVHSDGLLYARICYIDKYHSDAFTDCSAWRGWLLGDSPARVECSPVGCHDTSHGYPEDTFEVYDDEAYLAVNSPEYRYSCVLDARNLGQITIEGAGLAPKPPFFIARRPMGPPYRVRARVRLAIRSLWDYPDVQVVLRERERRAANFPIPYLENDEAERRAAARVMKPPLDFHLPISFKNGDAVTNGTVMLHDADENLFCNCSLFIPEGIGSDLVGNDLFRSVAHLHISGGPPITRTIAKVIAVHSVVPL